MIPPLCIIQARYQSARLPGKMLLRLGGETLLARGHELACEAFGAGNVVVAIPASDDRGPLGEDLRRIKATIFAWEGDEADVLGRFYYCAHRYRWHPDSVIVRWTPDDPFKDPAMCRRVAAGERLPVEQGAEAFTLAMLGNAHFGWEGYPANREHLTLSLFLTAPPPAPEGEVWTIDTPDDYERAKVRLARERW